MSIPPNPIDWYDTHAREIAPRYEDVSAQERATWYADLLPAAAAARSGRLHGRNDL